MKRVESAVIAGWAFLALSPLLDARSPYILWGATALLIAMLAVSKRTFTGRIAMPAPIAVLSFGMVIAILAAAVARQQTFYDVEQAVKLVLILLVALPLAIQTGPRRDALWAGSELALYANAAAIAAGVAISPVFFGLQGFARFGTCLASPGSLWRVGAIGIAAAFRIGERRAKHAKIRQAICLSIGIALVAVDGSRTGMLVAGLAACAGLWKLLKNLYHRPAGALAACACLCVGGALAYQSPVVNEAVETYGVIARIQSRIDSSGAGGVSAEDMDFARRNMLEDVLGAIQDHPIIGSGMGTTMTQTEAGLMVVHFSYLQMWADTGLPGFISYTLLMFWGVWFAGKNAVIRRGGRRMPWYAVYLAAGWALAGFFHPVSTEASEWIWFTLVMALVVEYLAEREKNAPAGAQTTEARITA